MRQNVTNCPYIDETFVATFANWVEELKELLVVSRFGAGDRDYLLCTSVDDLHRFCKSTAQGYRSASIAAFRTLRMEMRGTVDTVFMERVKSTFVDSDELLVLRLTPQKTGLLTGNGCGTAAELLAELHDAFGEPVAIDRFPEWDSFSTQAPEETGYIHTAIDRS